MSIPDFLNENLVDWYYHQTTGMTDVNTMISDLRTALVTNLGWSEPTTALFQSPPDSAGIFIDVLVTRISATVLEVRHRDYRGSALTTRRISIDATATVNYFCTQRGYLIESLRATPEMAMAQLLDPSPDAESEVDNRFISEASLTTASGNDNQGQNVGQMRGFDNGVDTLGNPRTVYRYGYIGATAQGVDGAGNYVYGGVEVCFNQAGAVRNTGRIYHALFCDSTLAFGTDKTVKLDDAGNLGTFRVVGFITSQGHRMMFRKA